jgi:hypothetical protein
MAFSHKEPPRSMLKEACKRKPLSMMSRSQANKYHYIDGMQESLNKNI